MTKNTAKQKSVLAVSPEIYEAVKNAKVQYAAKKGRDLKLYEYVELALAAGIKNLK